MKRFFLPFLLLASAAVAQASAPNSVADLNGFISVWRQDCRNGCGLPTAAGKSEALSARVDIPASAGEARSAKIVRDLTFAPGGEKVRAEISVFFVCPRGASPAPGVDTCPSRYFQVQIALSGDATAFCGAALNPADAEPFPVLQCAGENRRGAGERLGVTVSRRTVVALADF